MRYTPEHKKAARARLLETGGALAKQNGFGVTGVDGFMAAVGLTSGAFYSHFRSKSELLKAIVESELSNSLERLSVESNEQLQGVLEAYLSIWHANNPAQGCALPTLSAEIGRADLDTRASFEQSVLQIKDKFQAHLKDENEAWAMLAQAVGAVTIARAMATEASRKKIFDAVKTKVKEAISHAEIPASTV
ncbi:MAG TPA: TetR/AcrR family transcriptional regulator [Rhodocyclaceae bacterium]|nr:TetR/AcrR family transcriptional regulator [Rhodocyclaceae bacterium]